MEEIRRLRELREVFATRGRRNLSPHGRNPEKPILTNLQINVIKKLRKARIEQEEGEPPATVRTHDRSLIILPEMIGSIMAIYNGKIWVEIEIKPQMIGHHLGEYSMPVTRVGHGGGAQTEKKRFKAR